MVSASHISLLLLLFSLQAVTSTRFKIAIPSGKDAYGALARSARDAGAACQEYTTIDDPSTLTYPASFEHLRRPWVDNPTAKAGRSDPVTAGINRFFTLKVPGLGGTIISEVLDILKQDGCLSFPYGGSVRDQFLEAPPVDLDMETNCDADTFYGICVQNWGVTNCPRFSPTSPIIHIGNSAAKDGETEILDAANWNATFFGTGKDLEYTTNANTYFAENLNIVIDLTGTGVTDTCNKIIRIPVDPGDRSEWVSNTKVYRFWKLRIKGYQASDIDTMSYIVSEAKTRIQKNPKYFQQFYCKTVLNGYYDNSKCKVTDCREGLSKKIKYDAAFGMDLDTFWNETAMALIDGLECNSCSGVVDDGTCTAGAAELHSQASLFMLVLSFILGAILM